MLQELVNNPSSGNRPGAKDVAILITDGISTYDNNK